MDQAELESNQASVTSTSVISGFLHLDDPDAGRRVALATKGDHGWEELTYGQLGRRSAQVRTWLRDHGVRMGDRVGLLGDSGHDWVASFFGVMRHGAVVLPLDTRLTVDELAQIWARSAPAALVVSRRLGASVHAMLTRLQLSPPVLMLEDIADCHDPAGSDATRSMDDPAVIVWTSGTTGTAKGVCLSLSNLDYAVTQSVAGQGTRGDDRWLSLLSPNHMLELSCGLLPSLRSGATYSFGRSLMPHEVVESMHERDINRMVVVPLVLRILRDELALRPTVARRVAALFCGGAPLDQELSAAYAEMGVPVYAGYGLTELAPTVSMNTPDHSRPGSVGRALAGTELRIVDGEIVVRSPGLTAGYWMDEDQTREVIDDDGWFHTGDLGHLDPEGYLHVTGRLKNLIVLESGKKVQPEEIESVLGASGHFAECCVVAVRVATKHRATSEQVGVVVVPTAQALAGRRSDAELKAAMVAEVDGLAVVLSAYKRPTVVEVWNQALPRTAKGSVRRAEVASLLLGRRVDT